MTTRHAIVAAAAFALVVGWGPDFARAETDLGCFDSAQSLEKQSLACTAIIDNAASSDFEKATALNTRGILQSRRGSEKDAFADFNAALALDPTSAEALNNRAWTLWKWGRNAEGLKDVEQALANDPSAPHIWDTRAHLRQTQADFSGAFNDYETAVGFGGDRMIRLYQCGLKERGMYTGPHNGVYTTETKAALKQCAYSAACDPLPANEYNEDCSSATS
jgi:tetratricopeptide (TPR) repeat protein